MSDETGVVPCPYKSLPDSAFWRRSVSGVAPEAIDPVLHPKFQIAPDARVATAGSCFAQNIARYLKKSGFNYYVAEPGHEVLGEDLLKAYNYGTFSARYGNIYTTRQLLQLFERAYGLCKPVDNIWRTADGWVDPFRPFIQPEGFASEAEFYADQAAHFAAIREIVETADVFVFTLGLTEAWENTQDGSVYALCPGCGAGEHRPDRHQFRNFSMTEVAADLQAAIQFMTERNPNVRVLLTVSPVPLIATFEKQHVLTATTYSKSVLRVAAQEVANAHAHVDYFPSYEIITAGFSRGAYFGPDLRDVEEVGVQHAMRSFFTNYMVGGAPEAPAQTQPAQAVTSSTKLNDLVCDEEQLDRP